MQNGARGGAGGGGRGAGGGGGGGFFFNDTATTEIYTLSLHDALPICLVACVRWLLRRTDRGQVIVGADGVRVTDKGGGFVPMASVRSARVVRSQLMIERRDRKSTRLNSSHIPLSRMPSSA